MAEAMKAKQLLKQLLDDHYAQAWQAKEAGLPVGWVSSNFPQEFIEVFELTVVYPENQTAAISAKHESLEMIQRAEAMGYSPNLCGYARVSLAYAKDGQCQSLNMPQPDFLLCSNNICHQLLKWFENIAYEKNIPMIVFDAPFNHDYEVTPQRLDYMRSQADYLIGELEKISGKKFDPEKLQSVMDISNQAGRNWQRAAHYAQAKPCPINGFEMFNYMALMVCSRGKQSTADAIKLLADEMEDRYHRGETTFKGEPKYRILMEGIACWPHLGHSGTFLKQNGINMTGTVYAQTWGRTYDSLDEMLISYSVVLDNINVERASDRRVNLARQACCDGVLIHLNRSCRAWDGFLYEMDRHIREQTGLPSAMFDGDQSDPRCYSEAQFETRVLGLCEAMERRLDERGNR